MKENFLIFFCILSFFSISIAQYTVNTSQYELLMKQNTELLIDKITSHEELIKVFHPHYVNNTETDNKIDPFLYNNTLYDSENNILYSFEYPASANYRVGLIIDPCRHNPFNCCINIFGSPEYPSLLKSPLEQERVLKSFVLADYDEVSLNYFLINEDGATISQSDSRMPDDISIYDESCEGRNYPYSYCQARNYAYKRSIYRPPCMDNNSTLNTLDYCYEVIKKNDYEGILDSTLLQTVGEKLTLDTVYSLQDDDIEERTSDVLKLDSNNDDEIVVDGGDVIGIKREKCVQIGFTSNTFIPICKNRTDENCGTFIEIHTPLGTPYDPSIEVISEKKITERNVSGYYTTHIDLTYKGNSSRVLCSYTESPKRLRVGLRVYVRNTAPTCCCPPAYLTENRGDFHNEVDEAGDTDGNAFLHQHVGSFFCPIGPSGEGPFGYLPKHITDVISIDNLIGDFPYCPIDITAKEDMLLCSMYDSVIRRTYVDNCADVYYDATLKDFKYTSDHLQGDYNGICPYFSSCSLSDDTKCKFSDLKFTFVGQVGLITDLDNEADIPQAWVTFNNGRTSYQFSQEDLILETRTQSMYEMWWVVRSKNRRTVLKRKSFNVTSPSCTFDTTHDRYFPFAILKDGVPLDHSAYP